MTSQARASKRLGHAATTPNRPMKRVTIPKTTSSSWRPFAAFGSAVVLALAALAAPTSFAIGEGEGTPARPGDLASDPMVGTLPMIGMGQEMFDQTLTLRGPIGLLREAVQDATGLGYFEVIHLGNDQGWARFYGDVTLELDLDLLAHLTVGLFAGFEGEGMNYVVSTATTVSSPQGLMSGFELMLDPLRLDNAGLLADPVFIHAMHNNGTRTTTSIEPIESQNPGSVSSSILIRQDV